MNALTLAILAYVGLQLLVGMWVSRRVMTEDDYIVGGRRLGYLLATFTIFATWFGAETCIGAAGAIYTDGLAGASADPFGYTLCILFMGLFFAVRLWKLRLTTIADLFRRRYSPGVERFVVLLMVPTSLLWGAAQIRAFGQVLSASSDLAVTFTITIAALVVIAYTMSGGLLADAYTDLVQGISLTLGLLVLFIAVLLKHGTEPFAAIEPHRLGLFNDSTPILGRVEAYAIPVLGSAFAAELVSRIIATRSPQVAKRSSLVAAGAYLAIGLIPALLGLIGPRLIPNLADAEQVLPMIAQAHLPGFLYVVFAGALVSAILSTVDSSLLCAASMTSHNIIVPLRPRMSDAARVRAARIGVVVFGALAYVLALYAEGVYALVEEASAFGSAGVFIVAILGLFTRFGGSSSAFAALATGVFAWVIGAHVLHLPYPYVTSLAAAFVAYVIPAWFARERAGATIQGSAA